MLWESIGLESPPGDPNRDRGEGIYPETLPNLKPGLPSIPAAGNL